MLAPYCIQASLCMLDVPMEENTERIAIDPDPEPGLDNGAEPLAESGFEEEHPEIDFDERM